MSEAVERKRLFRPTPFRVGVLAGLGVFLLLAALSYAVLQAVSPDRPYDVEVVSSGAALSRYGTRQLEVRTTYGKIMRQTCNGACDDLTYRAKAPGENSYSVAVLDKSGDCISCEASAYTGGTILDSAARFEIRDDGAPLVDTDMRRAAKPAADQTAKPD